MYKYKHKVRIGTYAWCLCSPSPQSPVGIQCHPKVLGQFVKLTKSRYAQNSSHSMQNNQILAKVNSGQQTLLIEDKAPCVVGLDLDPKMFTEVNILQQLQELIYYHFVPEFLESTVFLHCKIVQKRQLQNFHRVS